MPVDLEVYDFLRSLFADGKYHTTGEIVKLLTDKFSLSTTQAMRRVAVLCRAGEIQKVRRGIFQKVLIPEPDEQLYNIFVKLNETIVMSLLPDMDVSEFTDGYRLALCELIYIWTKVREVIARLEQEED